jgi:hypothetical protein
VLRPSNSLLGSSKAAIRANARAERVRMLSAFFRAIKALILVLFAVVTEIVILWVLPFLYLAAAYLALDLPARWLTHRDAGGAWGVLAFIASIILGLVGLVRAVQGSTPVAPVRPQFAKAMFGLSWVAALLMTIGDLAS